MQAIFVILLTVCSLVASEHPDLGEVLPYIVKCRVNMQDLEKCIQDSIHSMRRILSRGVPLLEIEPLGLYQIPHYEVNLTEPPRSSIQFDGMSINGLTNYHIYDVRINDNISEIYINAFFPLITTYTNYKIKGKPADIFLPKRGKMSVVIYETAAVIGIRGVYYLRRNDGYYYFTVYSVKVSLNIKEMTLSFKKVTKVANNTYDTEQKKTRYVSRSYHWWEIFPNMMSQLEHIAADLIESTANKIYSKFPISKLLYN